MAGQSSGHRSSHPCARKTGAGKCPQGTPPALRPHGSPQGCSQSTYTNGLCFQAKVCSLAPGHLPHSYKTSSRPSMNSYALSLFAPLHLSLDGCCASSAYTCSFSYSAHSFEHLLHFRNNAISWEPRKTLTSRGCCVSWEGI